MESKEQRIGNYILGQTLGCGTTGKVKLAQSVLDNQKYAVKIIKREFLDTKPEMSKKIHREIALMSFLDHPHLLKLVEFFESPRHLYIVMEYAPNGELFDYLITRRTCAPDRALRFFRQIIYGLEYLHSHGFCHRDLKPENILLDGANQLKIGDFGFARWMRSNVAETSCGSPHYASPEVIRGIKYDGRCADIWSSGVILYTLLSGSLPFDDSSIRNLLAKVKAGDFYMPNFDKPIQDLISRILTVDPSQRITIPQIKQHPAFRMYVPESYVFPVPIPLPYIPAPIDISTVDESIYRVLLNLGYSSIDDIKTDLTANSHNMAKVFYTKLMNCVSLRTLPWVDLHNSNLGKIVDPECFIIQPQETSFPLDAAHTNDPYKRHQHICVASSSPDLFSLVDRTIFVPIEEVSHLTESPAEEQEFTLEIPLESFMDVAQKVLRMYGYDFFHPNDVHLIGRKDHPEVYILFDALCFSENQIDVKLSRYMGDESEFESIISALTSDLQDLLGEAASF
ncbi:CAMK family protein kinase [Trichomonas vaginalis G3]|uniref:CAMK family protein kinase n=1 Tax=Trichomonas vaginalis (strain ATCC PRA-98 / G3) TaxID=412133 RepID=A2EU91_TRIV3|nr:protein serine/threonine kinase protein [Trichomonas vaginalis G3]EAY03778.1 CAMK family protein kinase [Trichomonas vaginalis G3]KAI5494232.1 protein serine/threonine kinase protein [Trichomonas vaginalis G3]|eukprot:XP_001316001.1 CAMK family protein kinase [Trichomonas vaginalis G3]